MSVVKLTVHKNNKKQRERKLLRESAVKNTKFCVAPKNVIGYCVMSWMDDNSANIAWQINAGSQINIANVPAFLAQNITRKINLMDKEK